MGILPMHGLEPRAYQRMPTHGRDARNTNPRAQVRVRCSINLDISNIPLAACPSRGMG